MFKKICLILVFAPFVFAKTFNLEALYGFSYLNHPQQGYLHDVGLRAIFYMTDLTHEVLGRMVVASDTKVSNMDAKYSGWEAEYRIGSRLDTDMASLGMIAGSLYLGLGYQSVTQKYTNFNDTVGYIYIPLGIWGEDSMDMESLRLRYGLNLKMMLFNNDNLENKLKFKFLFGGKVYLGLGYNIANVMDIFAQAFFEYNAPMANLRKYGLEVGLQF